MKAQITSVRKTKSYHTKKDVYLVTFKADDGQSYKSWIDPGNGNFRRWNGLLHSGYVLDGLNVKGGRLIDADSFPRLVVEDE